MIEEKLWLEQNAFYTELDEEKLKSIFYFTLVWNIFEKECCNKFAKIDIHPMQLSNEYSERIDITLLESIFQYFKDRYIEDSEETEIFRDFKFDRNNNENQYKIYVKEILLSESPTTKLKIIALLYIAFRLRNNLFHGEKQVERLYDQNENFKQINNLLMAIIDIKKQIRRS